MRWATLAAFGATTMIGTFGCPRLSPFQCDDDDQCDRKGGGVCVDDECAYPDPECPGTMLRYSPNAGGVANVCVPPSHADTGSGTLVASGSSESSTSGGITGCGTTRDVQLDASVLGSTSFASYPALVVIPMSAGLASEAASDASDVWFAAEDGTALPHEIDAWDPMTGVLAAWVRLPGWQVGTPLTLVLHAGDPASTPTADPTAVWGDTFAGVWHLGDALNDGRMDVMHDSTIAANNGYAVGDMTADQRVPGVIGSALQFDGVDDEVQIDADFTGMLESFTITAWVRIDGDDTVAQPLFQQLNGTLFPRCRRLPADAGGNVFCQLELDGEEQLLQVGASEQVFTDGTLRHFALVYDAGTGEARLIVDGEQVDSATATAAVPPVGGGDRFGLGRIEEFGTLDGMLDEVRISLAVLDPAWISADYRVQSTPANLVVAVGPALPWSCP
jgi:hypothetical protein